MRQIIPEIYIRDCRQALEVYQSLFGGEIRNLQMAEDLELFQDHKGKVVHAELHINSRCVIYLVDVFEEKRSRTGNVTVMLHMDSLSQLKKAYDALARGGKVAMPLQKTFWGAWHAIVTDRFGAPWALNFAGKEK